MISTWISHYLYLNTNYYDYDLLWYTKDHFTSMNTSALHTYWIMNAKNLERWQGKQQHCTLGSSLEGSGSERVMVNYLQKLALWKTCSRGGIGQTLWEICHEKGTTLRVLFPTLKNAGSVLMVNNYVLDGWSKRFIPTGESVHSWSIILLANINLIRNINFVYIHYNAKCL